MEFERTSLDNICTLRPRRESPFGDKAQQIAKEFAQKYGMYSHNFEAFNTMSRFAYPDSVSAERLAAAATTHNTFFFIDDMFFDQALSPDDHEIPGIAFAERGTFLQELMIAFVTGDAPEDSSLMHKGLADIGRQLRGFTSEEWLKLMVAAVTDYLAAADQRRLIEYSSPSTDFLNMRDNDTGGLQTCMLLEVTNDCVLPAEARNDPILGKMTWLTYRSAAWVNDIISYHKDVIIEGSEFNLVHVLMKDGNTFDQAVIESIGLVNTQIQHFLELEAQLPSWGKKTDRIVERYVSGLKDLMSGNTYWHLTSPRYRHPDSPFPELAEAA